MKTKLLIVLSFFVSVSAFADRSFTLVDNGTGQRFYCDNNGGGGGGGSDQRCIENVSNYCYNNTSFGRNACFEKASNACRNVNAGFSDCVASSATYCYNNTSYGRNECFERALQSCGGNFDAIRELIEASKTKALLESRVRL